MSPQGCSRSALVSRWMSPPEQVILSIQAMATRFELVIYGDDAVRMRAAGEEALSEIARLDSQLSFYNPASEISFINLHAANGPVKVEPRLFHLLADCRSLTELTRGAFDVTIGPLVSLWRHAGADGRTPSGTEIVALTNAIGMTRVELDESNFTVHFQNSCIEIDLGAYAKGYAINRAIELLREAGIKDALLHGGTSSVFAMGAPPDERSWRIALHESLRGSSDEMVIELSNSALSVSAVHGRSFVVDGESYGHVIDPLTGRPVAGAVATAVIGPSPAICEALSTALLVRGIASDGEDNAPTEERSRGFARTDWIGRFPAYQAILALPDGSLLRIPQS